MLNSRTVTLAALGLALLAVGSWFAGRSPLKTPAEAIVVYCAHDAEYSEPILKEFERRTGIPILIRFDSEASKTLGLVNLLIEEQAQPRCDVFWSNELLSMLSLKQRGVLQPYRGAGYQRIPEQYKDPDGAWTGFAARFRVHILNTQALRDATQDQIEQAWESDHVDELAIAKPLYGTTLVHYCVLADAWGLDRLKTWHRTQRKRGLKEVNGNATVKNLVAQAACKAGLTDTDDYYIAVDAHQPVAMLPVKVNQHTLCIPNCVALIRGSQKVANAQKLIDYLLSEETETKLAQSTARQVPLGSVDSSQIPVEVRELAEWANSGYDLRGLQPVREAVVAWLTEEYLGK